MNFNPKKACRATAAVTGFVTGAMLLWSASASAALINSYDFNGDLTDTLGNGADLVASGGSLATSGLYGFDAGQGLRLTSAFSDPATYAIEIKFHLSNLDQRWKKIIDFKDRTVDDGLYVRRGPNLGDVDHLFFENAVPQAVGATEITALTDMIMTFTRDGGTGEVNGYIDGLLQFTFTDSNNFAFASGNILNFFVDGDSGGLRNDNPVGSVDYIRIFDTVSTDFPLVVSEPGMMAVFGFGLAGLGFARRRRAT